ncbi:MBL fold metallo-hydrolase [Acidobacteriia bacterium AH_259_A11_L15]|nr:MBL fold metallo-hydrolase [Acidobacteriia bacterium AH_259_A11_L15]
MKRIVVALTVGLAVFCASPARAQRDWSQVELKVEPVRGNIYMINGTGGNIGVSVGEDGILIVDDKFEPLAEKIRAALAEVGGGELKFILNTHWHGDHTGANPVFGPEAPIIAHTNVRRRLSTEQQRGNRTLPAMDEKGWPVITFDQSVSVHFNGEEIKVIHFPHGHTDGDSVIFFTGSNVVHMGDDFFAGRFPFVDLASGGSVKGLTRNIGRIIKKLPEDVAVIPGHGPLSTLDDLRQYHRMLVETTDHVRQQMLAGKSLAQIKAEGLPEEWDSWSWQFISTERWIETIWNSLLQARSHRRQR